MATTLNAKHFYDALCSDLTGTILGCMPNGSTAFVYGGLAMTNAGAVNPGDLIFKGKTLKGFWLTDWLKGQNLLGLYLLTGKLMDLLKGDLKTDVANVCSF